MIRRLIPGLATFVLAGCAVTPLQPLPPSHPASPAATESAMAPRSSLSSDAATQKTNDLLTKP